MVITLTRWAFGEASDSVAALLAAVGSVAYMDSILESAVDSSSAVDCVAGGGGRGLSPIPYLLLSELVAGHHTHKSLPAH
jgi:hypothetical protein